MAAGRNLRFSEFCISDEIFPISFMPRYTQFKFQPKSSIHAEVIYILVNTILHFWWNFPICVMPRYMQFKFQPKSSIHAEVINILVNPRWRPAAIFDFHNFFIFVMKFSNSCCAKVYIVQISAKKLNPRGSY